MDQLCDEILQLILNELNSPAAFAALSKRHYEFGKDPYVRAMYFLARHGHIQALYWALGRGRLLNERVLDILLGSGAHLSRYLAQMAIHHYFRTQVSFIKTRWVRTLTLPVFTHFLSIASRLYGDIPVGKGEDDGTILSLFLKQSRFPTEYRAAKWEQVRDVVEKYKFIPFSDRDPMMAQYPLVLAIEPRLLPFARQNGFHMDRKYRDFVFRRMFEKPAVMFESRADEIVQNVRELSRLDTDMFLSRTVAAEICMEAKTNEPAYAALKRLDKEGVLRFELSSVVQDLIKLFLNTRSVTTTHTASVLRVLHKDFPSEDPTVRLVLLLTVFLSDPSHLPESLVPTPNTAGLFERYVESCSDEIEDMNLGPLTRKDIVDILLSKFVPERFGGILEYARSVLDLDKEAMRCVITEVALGCLEIGCKGRMLAKLVATYSYLSDVIASHIVKTYRIQLEDLPPAEDEKACKEFAAPLCADLLLMRKGIPMTFEEVAAPLVPPTVEPAPPPQPESEPAENEEEVGAGEDEVEEGAEGPETPAETEGEDLGVIGQDTLSAMIRKDEMQPSRRRRYHELYTNYHDSIGKLPYPADYTQVGTWIQNHYGHLSAVAAVIRLHAVINQNYTVLHHYLYNGDGPAHSGRVPTTLKQFKILARLGRTPSMSLYDDIEAGTEFYFSEEDYLSQEELNGTAQPPLKKATRRAKVKCEASPTPGPSSAGMPTSRQAEAAGPSAGPSAGAGSQGRKRPRRSVASSVKSYVVPDSDDEDIVMEGEDDILQKFAKKRRQETNMQRWIKQLAILFKEEQRKYNERKRRIHTLSPPGAKVKVPKTEFHKSLAFNLPRLRRIDRVRREKLYGTDIADVDMSESDEDEYQYRTTRSKRRKVEN
ncbi:hypothetical protein BD311DRAFT_694525 [Dichomitus squalens]|uniref:Uncharacterized protein n=1 Tax=Dichomitus squalens TaxID=114155 RepID=A0A4Q9MLZ0_9APHY|nr:hypothetical protein BD311DRAFT_694525 [Dichomitus squalens]